MNIINTNILSSNQYHDARSLIDICREADNSDGIAFLEPEMNVYTNFPCFFLMYESSTLISFLSIFIPDEGECEIYANTLPEYRNNGYFKELYNLAVKKINSYGIKKILIVNDPASLSGVSAIHSVGGSFLHSEFMMEYNMSLEPNPKHSLTIMSDTINQTEYFSSFHGELQVGSCKVEHIRGAATIYEFEVLAKERGKGYGTETLLLVLDELINSGCHKILLEVSSQNTAAYAMYSHHGFIHSSQIDYYMV